MVINFLFVDLIWLDSVGKNLTVWLRAHRRRPWQKIARIRKIRRPCRNDRLLTWLGTKYICSFIQTDVDMISTTVICNITIRFRSNRISQSGVFNPIPFTRSITHVSISCRRQSRRYFSWRRDRLFWAPFWNISGGFCLHWIWKRYVQTTNWSQAKAQAQASYFKSLLKRISSTLIYIYPVSQGAQEIFKLLPHTFVHPSQLPGTCSESSKRQLNVFGCVVTSEHMVIPKDPTQTFDKVTQIFYLWQHRSITCSD